MTDQSTSTPPLNRLRAGTSSKFIGISSSDDGTRRYVPTLRGVVFAMMLLVAMLPVAGLYSWVERNSFNRELSAVHETHLIIAKNLSSALSRYATDAKAVFQLAVENLHSPVRSGDFGRALSNFHICHVVLLDEAGNETARMEGDHEHDVSPIAPELLAEMRQVATGAAGQVAITGIRQIGEGAHFFIVQLLEDGQIAVAPLGPDYVIELQKSIAFGERGHSMVVDQDGLVVAHPNAEWQRISKDASPLPVVQAMMKGGTGVMQFYSPPMQADMIAGYTFVPETGWGVMVPQPISELAERAHGVQSAAVIVAALQLLLAVALSWWLSTWLTRPILSISSAARSLSRGNLSTRIGELPKYTPIEIAQTAKTFDAMADGIGRTTDRLRLALSEAERVSGERAQLLEAAQEANAVKSQFVSMVSHELRTPLTSIKGALGLLNTTAAGNLPQETKSLVDIASRNGERLARLIDDLLDLEKLDAGKLQFDFAEVDLGDLVAEAIEANSGYASLAGVTFDYCRPDGQVIVTADSHRLAQVLANLFSNAAKFSSSGDRVDVSVEAADGQGVIRVRDYGIGIPDSAGDVIFEVFSQIDSSASRVAEGSGLGLNIARTIVDRHHGRLSYVSKEGEGTTFVVTLPLTGQG